MKKKANGQHGGTRARNKAKIKETALYPPLRDYLVSQGYEVRAEVDGCDVVAIKNDEVTVVEMKLKFGLALVIQGTDRQKAADMVYIAVPGPLDLGRDGPWPKRRHLLRRLELGLIQVFTGSPSYVEVVDHPRPFQRRKNLSRRRGILAEARGRSADYNEGGSTGRKLVTVYRESAINIAAALEKAGPRRPKDLMRMGCSPKTQAILYHNVYEWFRRLGGGLYELSAEGRKALSDYSVLAERFRKKLEKGKSFFA